MNCHESKYSLSSQHEEDGGVHIHDQVQEHLCEGDGEVADEDEHAGGQEDGDHVAGLGSPQRYVHKQAFPPRTILRTVVDAFKVILKEVLRPCQ